MSILARPSETFKATSRLKLGAACGLAGPAALAVYFAAPAFAGWPYAGEPAAAVARYATSHATLFLVGTWLQGTGTVLCVVFFVVLLHATGPLSRLAAAIALVSAGALLSIVLVEGAFLAAVPSAAAAGDSSTVATAFALSNGAFLRVFPIAPASLTYVALGAAVLGSPVLDRRLPVIAIGLGVAFELAGLASVFTGYALAAIAVLSALQAIWIAAAAVSMWRSS
jgi:hypothetical protein